MVSGGFRFTVIKSFLPIFYEESMTLSEIFQNNSDLKSKECDISVPIAMATLEMIGRTALGIKFNAQTGNRHKFVENLKKTMQVCVF